MWSWPMRGSGGLLISPQQFSDHPTANKHLISLRFVRKIAAVNNII